MTESWVVDPDIPHGDIIFSLHGREVVRFTMTPSGEFDIVTPPDLPLTKAAEQFIEILREQIPLLWVTANPGNTTPQ